MDTVICAYASVCNDWTCPHHEPHEEGPQCTGCEPVTVTDAECELVETGKVVTLVIREKAA